MLAELGRVNGRDTPRPRLLPGAGPGPHTPTRTLPWYLRTWFEGNTSVGPLGRNTAPPPPPQPSSSLSVFSRHRQAARAATGVVVVLCAGRPSWVCLAQPKRSGQSSLRWRTMFCFRRFTHDTHRRRPPSCRGSASDDSRVLVRYSPTVPSIASRRKSAWPAWRAVSSMRCCSTHRSEKCRPSRSVLADG